MYAKVWFCFYPYVHMKKSCLLVYARHHKFSYGHIFICASIFSVAFLLFDDFDDSARAESRCAEFDKLLGVLD